MIDLAKARLATHEIEAVICRLLRLGGDFDRVSIGLQRAQSVGNILKRVDHRGAILRFGQRETSFRRLLLVQQRHAVKNRLRGVRGEKVEACARSEELGKLQRAAPAAGRQRNIREPRGDGDPNQGVR